METNSTDTIGTIISYLLSESFDATILSLSEACNIPIPQMRKFIACIFENKILLSHLYPSPIVDDYDDDPIHTAELFLDKLKSGKADNELIYLIDMKEFIEDYCLLPISSVETGYINNVYPKLLQNQRTSLFETKTVIDSIPRLIVEKQNTVQNAISQEKQIEFNYKSPQYELTKIVCSPVSVIQNLTTHILYIKDSDDNYYRIDRIKSNITILPDKSDIARYHASPYQKYFWGTEYKSHGDPIHVKLQISAGTSNIITKIRNDTILRSQTSKLYQIDEYYYYEDDILGIQDFRRWLRSYGSSITVIEPQSLINEIIDGAKKTLSYYGELNSIYPQSIKAANED